MVLTVISIILLLKLCSSGPITSGDVENLSQRQVNTKYGAIRGTYVSFTPSQQSLSSQINSINLATIEAFLGVPYATPPIGSLRFMPPVTPTHWRGTRLANKLSPVCPQRIPLSKLIMNNSTEALKRMPLQRFEYMRKLIPLLKNQSEDCLYLNIYIPTVAQSGPQMASATNINNKVPVLVFIHGESYDWNSGNVYDGSLLASFGQVIIVTLNYRLGILGFLPVLVDGSVRGNYGLMDQVAALHWIQENIGEFGGQPNNVTIIGHGYGAACAHLLMISPMAKGLFSRVILMSGSALSPWAIARDTDLYAKNLAQALNCPIHDSIVDCLRKRKVDDILKVELRIPDHLTAFGPIIDSIVVPSDPRKHQLPTVRTNTNINSNAKLNKAAHNVGTQYDLLFGANKLEGPCLFAAHEEKLGIDVSRRDRLLRTLVRNLFDFHQQAIFLTLINEYTDWSRPVEQPINILESMADILSDSLVVSPLIQTGDLHSAQHQIESTSLPAINGKTFFYVFLHQNEEMTSNKIHQKQSCSHSEELAYMFGAPLSHHLLGKSMAHLATNYSKAEVALSEAFMTYWINFAKFGDPNIWPQDSDSSHSTDRSLSSGSQSNSKIRYDNVVWPTYDPIQRKFLMIGLKPKVRDHYHSHRLSFWLNLIPRLHHPGEEQVYMRHHLLTDHENLATYDGIVRQIAFKFLAPLPTVSQNIVISATTELVQHVSTLITTEVLELTTTSISDINNPTAFPAKNVNNTTSTSVIVQNGNYSTALSVTIAIGCSLLILNMLIFAGVYYQLDKNRTIAQHNNQRQTESIPSQDENLMISDKLDEPNVSRMTIPSPISNMMQSDPIDHMTDHIYYQYKNSKYNMSNNIGNANSLKRAHKVAVPTVPAVPTAKKTSHDQASQVPLQLTNDLKHIPVYIEHNSLAKEMAV